MEEDQFDVERFISGWESVHFADGSDLPNTEGFMNAFKDILVIFDSFGTGFGFVKSDIVLKLGIIRGIYEADTEGNQTLQVMVEREVKAGTARNKKKQGGSRNLLRLMWGVQFIRLMLKEIGTREDITAPEAIRAAYDAALREHHPWAIRTAVSAAIHFVPSKDVLLKKLNIDIERRTEYLGRCESSLGPLIDRMYGYYEKNGLLDLP